MAASDPELAKSLKAMLRSTSATSSAAVATMTLADAERALSSGNVGTVSSSASVPTMWRYSDDAQMMISVAESLLRSSRVSVEDLLTTMAANYEATRGYEPGLRPALEAIKAGRRTGAFATWQNGSQGNGGAVRIAPIACVFHDDARLVSFAEESAGATHAHPLGRAGAVAQAMSIAHALARQNTTRKIAAPSLLKRAARPLVVKTGLASKLEAVERLVNASAKAPEAARILGNGQNAEQSVPLAIFCFIRWAPDFEAVITNAVLAGGDTDTIAAMAGSICGALVGEEAIPEKWLSRLEGEVKGPAYVRDLADQLFDMSEALKADTPPAPPTQQKPD